MLQKNRVAAIFAAAAGVMFLALGRPAAADQVDLGIAVGTAGIAPGVAFHLPSGGRIRLDYGSYTFGRQETYDNQVIDARVKLLLNETFRIRTTALTFERTSAKGLGIAAGLVFNNNQIHAISVPQGSSFTIGGTVYSAADSGVIFTDVTWQHVDPYLGFVVAPRGGRGFYADLGAFYQGLATVGFSATGAIAANHDKFQPYYDNETAQLRTQLSPVRFYPRIQIGYRVPIR